MLEMKPSEENGQTIPLKVNDFGEEQSFLKKNRLYIIIASIILLIVILIVVLCVCLLGNSDEKQLPPSDNEETDDLINIKNNIDLQVYSDGDDKEISFLSSEYDFEQISSKNSAVNPRLYVDYKKYSFSKSMKLKKGFHDVTIIFDDKINYCQKMFKNCKDIKKIYLNITNECNNMDYMFSGCSSLEEFRSDNFSTTEVISMKNLFSGCTSLENIILDDFDTGKVVNMEEMFSDCNSTKEIRLNNFNTTSVTNMKGMFRGCKSLGNLSLYFDTTSVTNMDNMFSGCSSSEQIYLGDFVTSSVISMNEMFSGCSKVKRIYMPLFDTFNAKYMYHIFYDCNSLIDLDISNVVLYNLETNLNDLFGNIENNSYLKNIYNKLVEMKKEENIINDIDFNLVMEITIYPRQNFVYIFGNSFNLYQIENSKMYVESGI